MEFRTAIHLAENQGMLRHSDAVMLIGSCFSDNIGARMRHAMMNALVNPLGTIYNPLSIAAAIERIATGTHIAGNDLFQHSGVWNSYCFHSRFSLADKQATLDLMNGSIDKANDMLATCDMLVLTLGTAIVYRLRATGEVVSNCHKVPQHEFTRRMATLDEMVDALRRTVALVRQCNPATRIVFTVSPLRHVADGLEANSLSKALLRVAVATVADTLHDELVHYFPAYEIMMDDLRDYRFYAADMIHPTDVAIEYIWQSFQACYCDDRTAQAIARCERVYKRLQHRPMSDNRETVERFNADTQAVIRNLKREYPYLNLDND